MRFIFLFIFFFVNIFTNNLHLEVFAKNAILINPENEIILYQKNIHEKIYPASLTKIATALYILDKKQDIVNKYAFATKEALKRIDPLKKRNSNYTLAPYLLETDGTTFGIKIGEEISIKSLLYSLMMVSGNDSANVLAENASTNIASFMKELNVYMLNLGLASTHFVNPHGLHHPNHFSTVYDLAMLTKKAISFPFFKKLVSTLSYTTPSTNKQKAKEILQYNRIVKAGKYKYPYAIGVKTGYHSKAGYNLATAATYNGRTLIAILCGGKKSEYRYIDAKKLFDAAFSEEKKSIKIFDKNKSFEASIEGGSSNLIAVLKSDFIYEYYPSEKVDYKLVVFFNDLKLPIKKDQEIGKLQLITAKGTVLYSEKLYCSKNVNRKLTYILKQFFNKLFS